MANHLRRMIRERVATMLTGLSSTGSNVFLPHVCPLENDDLPSLCIYTQDEEIEVGASGDPRVYHSTMILIVDGYVQTFSNLDDHLYQIGIEVQVAMAGDIYIYLQPFQRFISVIGRHFLFRRRHQSDWNH